MELPGEASEASAKLPVIKTEPTGVSAPAATAATGASTSSGSKPMPALKYQTENGPSTSTAAATAGGSGSSADSKYVYPAASFANIPQKMLRQLIQTGHLQLHAEDGECPDPEIYKPLRYNLNPFYLHRWQPVCDHTPKLHSSQPNQKQQAIGWH